MKLSIVICTHNRRALLARTVASLNEARPPRGWEVELVVVANACTDATVAWLSEYGGGPAERLRLTFLEEPIPGKSRALNRGLAAAGGELIALVDDDHRVAAGWMEAVAGAAEAYPETLCFCGRVLPDWQGTEPSWVRDEGPYRIRPYPVPKFDMGEEPALVSLDTFLPGGGNLFFRPRLLEAVGGFDPRLGPRGHNLAGGEDVAFVVRILRAGLEIRYVPEALQYHYVDPRRLTWRYVVRKGYQRSRDLRCFTPPPPGRRLGGVPLYLFRQLVLHLWRAAATLDTDRRRHYCVRAASTLGEIHGYRQARRGRGGSGDPGLAKG
ncbi:MAG: glycosyltransferase family 2 protein [Nitrospirae bacterium]|nr:MAG: glycosyltransferase family 2 protein [Nitrospirota bacterium]